MSSKNILWGVWVTVLAGLAGLVYLTSRPNGMTDRQPVPAEPASEITFAEEAESDMFMVFVRDGDIYAANRHGNHFRVFETENEEPGQPFELEMKLSPDKKYVAYAGISGGVDAAIKIVDPEKKTKISQEVYAGSMIADFVWSPDGDRLAVAVTQRLGEKKYATSIRIIEPGSGSRLITLSEPENAEITRLIWPEADNLYYARIAYEPDESLDIVRYNPGSKEQLVRPIGQDNLESSKSYAGITDFSVDLLPASDGSDVFAYMFMKDEASWARGRNYDFVFLSLPDLEPKTVRFSYVMPQEAVRYRNYFIGREAIYGSPDSSLILITIPQNVHALSLMDMGPSGWYRQFEIIESGGRPILIVWEEFDEQNAIAAYDLEALITARKNKQTIQPMWTLDNAYSPGK